MLRGRHEVWRRLLSINSRQAKEIKPISQQRPRPRPPLAPEKARPPPIDRKPAVVLPRVNRPAVASAGGGSSMGGQAASATAGARPALAAQAQATSEQAAAATSSVEAELVDPLAPPSLRTLQLLALQRGVPFIGFGFMDNAIMIVSGDYIEMSIGVTLGISTLTAAALGNVIADVLGLNLGGLIEELSYKLGVPEPKLSRPQMEMGITRTVAFLGSSLGIAFGCLVGMLPLAVMALVSSEDGSTHRETTPKAVLSAVAARMADLLHCERAVVFEVDPTTGAITEQYQGGATAATAQSSSSGLPSFVTREVVERVLGSREGVSLQTDYYVSLSALDPSQPQPGVVTNPDMVRSVACLPVLDLEGRVIALLAAVNKEPTTSTTSSAKHAGAGAAAGGSDVVVVSAFTAEDERALAGICAQVSAAMINLGRRPEEQVSFAENVKLLKAHQALPVRGVYQV